MRASAWSGIGVLAFCLLLIGTQMGDRDEERPAEPLFGDITEPSLLFGGSGLPLEGPCRDLVFRYDRLMQWFTAIDKESVSADSWTRAGYVELATLQDEMDRAGCAEAQGVN